MLRKRTLLLVGVMLLALVLVPHAVLAQVLLRGFAQLEEGQARRDIARVRDTLAGEQKHLDRVAGDWGSWDDTYAFIAGGAPEYVVRNLDNSILVNLHLSLMVFLDLTGRVVYSKTIDLQSGDTLPTPPDLLASLHGDSPLLQHATPFSSCSGLLLLAEGPLMVASRPIVTSHLEGPIRGTLLVGRYLDESEFVRLAAPAGASLRVYQLGPGGPPELPGLPSLLAEEGIVIQAQSADRLVGYAVLNDLYGRPTLVLEMQTGREVYQHGVTTVWVLLVLFLAIGVIVGVTLLLLLERVVLSRLARLGSEVTALGTSGDLSRRVQLGGKDELANLATAINSLLETLERRTAQLDALRQLGLELTAQLDLDALLRSIVSRAIHLLGAVDGGLYMYRPGHDDLERVVSVGETIAVGSTLRRGEGLSGKVWESGTPLIVDRYQEWAGRAAIYAQEPDRAVVGVQVKWGDEFLGVLNVAALPPRTFTPADADLLGLFATQAAIAIRNARVLATVEEQRRRAEALSQATAALTSTLELEALLENVLTAAIRAIPAAEKGTVLLQDEAHGGLRVRAAVGYQDPRVRDLHLIGERWYSLQAARECRPLLIADARAEPFRYEGEIEEVRAIQSAIVAPLHCREHFIGVLSLDSASREAAFSAEDLHLLAIFADQVAVAVDNARLYQRLQQQMERLRDTQAQLIQSAKMAAIGELAAGVGHELNNPLTSILGFAELTLEDLPEQSPYRHNLERIIHEARRTRDIVQRLLHFAGQTRLQKQPTDISRLFQDTLALLRERLERGGVTIEEDYAPDLPVVSVDLGQISQVFLNLLTNAMQAMPEGGRLLLRTFRAGNEVAIAISDTGPGMPPEIRERLFEPFFSTKAKGTGLGLSVSLGLVQEHGGRITVESQVGKGSTFTVWLPQGEEFDGR